MIEEIEVFKPSCDGLPLECFGDEIQEETRKTPLCKNRGGEATTNIMLVIFPANNFKRMFGPFFFRLNKKID